MRPSSPPVTVRPSVGERDRIDRALVEPQHLDRGIAASSDQRIAEESKLPEIALAPSGAMASARTGPPCPRSCACASGIADASAMSAAAMLIRLQVFTAPS